MNLPWFCVCHAFSRSALNVEKQSTDGCVVWVEAPQYPSEFHDIFMGFTSIDRLDLTGFVGASNFETQPLTDTAHHFPSLRISDKKWQNWGFCTTRQHKKVPLFKKNVLVFSVITFVFGMCVLNQWGWSAEVAWGDLPNFPKSKQSGLGWGPSTATSCGEESRCWQPRWGRPAPDLLQDTMEDHWLLQKYQVTRLRITKIWGWWYQLMVVTGAGTDTATDNDD